MRKKRTYIISTNYLFLSFLIALTACSLFHKTNQTSEKTVTNSEAGYIYLPAKIAEKYYGFNIYRAENKEGPFVKVNQDIIIAPRSEERQILLYVDKSLKKGRDYYYYIEGVSFAGERKKITPVFKVVP